MYSSKNVTLSGVRFSFGSNYSNWFHFYYFLPDGLICLNLSGTPNVSKPKFKSDKLEEKYRII